MLNLDWKPNKTDDLPLYKQITEYIRTKIVNGEWPIGSTLPPQRELAEWFMVNRSTIAMAINELIADGLLESKVGSGTKVVNHTWSLTKPVVPPNWNRYMETGFYQANSATMHEIHQFTRQPGIIKLSSGELSPELYPADAMQKVLTNLPHRIKSLGYEDPKGLPFFRKQISIHLKSWGINASPSSILIVSGALQALQLISIGLLQSGTTILLENPSYLFSLNIFKSAGIHLCGLPMDSEGIKVANLAYQKKLTKEAFLYTIPNFQNPTGRVMSERRRKDLIALCEKEQLPIIEDDVYRELWFESPPPPPLKFFDKIGIVIYIGSLSKTLSSGLRIGWIVGPETVINRLAEIKMENDSGSSSLSQWAAASFIADGFYQQHLKNVRNHLALRRDVCIDILERHFKDIATWHIPLGGFYIWLNLTAPISLCKLFKTALKKGLLINPGNIYGRFNNRQIRISYSYLTIPELKHGLQHLASIIRELLLHHD